MTKGFTLIELLISITIVAVILVIVMGALRIGVKAWDAGERDIDINQRQQIVLSLMKRQLSSAGWNKINRKNEAPYYFGGKTDFIEFISGVSIEPGDNYGNVYVVYRIVSGDRDLVSLQVAEQSLERITPNMELFKPEDDEFQYLIKDAYDMSFEFLEPTGQGDTQWENEFEPGKTKGLPLAVRFNLKMTKQTPTVSIVARVTAEKDKSQ